MSREKRSEEGRKEGGPAGCCRAWTWSPEKPAVEQVRRDGAHRTGSDRTAREQEKRSQGTTLTAF